MFSRSAPVALLALLALLPPLVQAQGIRQFAGHHEPVSAVAFRPDGLCMASASFDRTIKVWNVPRGKVERTLRGHTGKVLALAWRRDGEVLASTALDGTIRLWTREGRCQAVLRSQERCLQGLDFSPDGRALVCCGEHGLVEVWDSRAGRRMASFRPVRGSLYSVAFRPDGREIATGGQDGNLRLLSLDGCVRQTLVGHGEPVYSLAFRPDGKELASGGEDRLVRRWQVGDGAPVGTCEGHREPVYQVGYSCDGRRLVSASTEGQVIVWDAGSGRSLHSQHFPCKTLCAAFTPDGRQVGTGTGTATCYLMELPRRVR